MARRDLPSGTVTLVFTDISGSTRLLDELGEQRYGRALADHREVVRTAFVRNGGIEVDTQGDSFFFVFSIPQQALLATSGAMTALESSGTARTRTPFSSLERGRRGSSSSHLRPWPASAIDSTTLRWRCSSSLRS